MTGYRGYVVQAVSTIGPIRRVDLGNTGDGLSNYIYGGLAQRWTSSAADGNYDQRSPGFYPEARNDLAPSELNFDSHYLYRPEVIESVVALRETIGPALGFLQFPFNPIPSTPEVGYGTAFYERFGFVGEATLQADVTIRPEFRPDVLDVAYVVSNSGFIVSGLIYTGDNTFGWGFGLAVDVVLPEPSSLLFLACSSVFVTSRSRRSTCVSVVSNPSSPADC